MYRQFYRFAHEPFADTTDLAWLFLSASHRAALQAISRGVEERRECIAVFGAAGVGKTMLLHAYLASIDEQRCKTIYLCYPTVTGDNILEHLCQACGLGTAAADFPDAIIYLQKALQEEHQHGRNVLLIIDDAQRLSLHNLENLLLLLQLGPTSGQLLQIIFVGQPEFRQRLRHFALDHIVCVTIAPLSKKASRGYIQQRLQKSLLRQSMVFTTRALKKIAAYAKGNPRRLNILCTEVLIFGALSYQKPISGALARQVMGDFERGRHGPLLRRGVVYASIVTLMLLVSLVWDSQHWQRLWPVIHHLTLSSLARFTTGGGHMQHAGRSPTATPHEPSMPPGRIAIEPEAKPAEVPLLLPVQPAHRTPDEVVPRDPETRQRSMGAIPYRESRPQEPARAEAHRPETTTPPRLPLPTPSPRPEPVAIASVAPTDAEPATDNKNSVPPDLQDTPTRTAFLTPVPPPPAISSDASAAEQEPGSPEPLPMPAVPTSQEPPRRLLRSLDQPAAPQMPPQEHPPPRPRSYASVEPEVRPQQKPANPAPETTKPATTQAPVHLANINSLPEFATVTIDGKKVGTTPLTVQIALGRHIIQVEKSGYTSIRYDITFDKAGTSNLYHDLHLNASSP